MKKIKVAFIGQPNVGKSSLLQKIAGGDVQIGNWAGITVDKHAARLKLENYELELVDLPGVYSLSPYSPEERVARDYLLFERPDVLVNVVEAPMLERNLFLTTQLLELEIPTVLALNMWDELEQKGFELNLKRLEEKLGIKTVPVVGKTGWNTDRLLDAIVETFDEGKKPKPVRFSDVIENALRRVEEKLRREPFFKKFPHRWLLIKALENDEYLAEWLKEHYGFDLGRCCKRERHYVQEAYNEPPDEAIAEERYRAVARIVKEVLKKPSRVHGDFQELLDRLLLNPIFGIPFFFAVMFLVFKLSYEAAAPLMVWVEGFVNDFLGKYILWILSKMDLPEAALSFVKDGIIGGIGFFATFIPLLVFIYLAIGFLEHSGYFARAAFVTDRFARTFGLTGKSTVPLILGFGCNVPAVLATRTLENPLLRRLTALLIPFMSCSARLPVYALLAVAFFPSAVAAAIFSMYILGIAVALSVAFILSRTVYRQVVDLPFLVEIPPYRLPSFKELLRAAWSPVWEFIHRAGTLILVANAAVWILMNVPHGVPPKETLLGRFASEVQPVFKPLGFGNRWENVAVLVPGFLAKEIIVTSYGTILGLQERKGAPKPQGLNPLKDITVQIIKLVRALSQSVKNVFLSLVPSALEENPPQRIVERIKKLFTKASALAFMVFVLLYTPCVSTVATFWQEFGAKFALLSILLSLSVAYLVSFLTYRVALLVFG
jgi:ferrous iron transport protein B